MIVTAHFSRSLAAVAGAFALSGTRAAEACTVCFGDPNSPLTKSAEMGVWFLLGVIFAVQAAFAIFFFGYLRRRSRRFPLPHPALRLVKHT